MKRGRFGLRQLSKEPLGWALEEEKMKQQVRRQGKRSSSRAKRFLMAYLGRDSDHRLTCPEAAYR
jgi:hypothetical protein